jgi:hypothetical protein
MVIYAIFMCILTGAGPVCSAYPLVDGADGFYGDIPVWASAAACKKSLIKNLGHLGPIDAHGQINFSGANELRGWYECRSRTVDTWQPSQ